MCVVDNWRKKNVNLDHVDVKIMVQPKCIIKFCWIQKKSYLILLLTKNNTCVLCNKISFRANIYLMMKRKKKNKNTNRIKWKTLLLNYVNINIFS